MIVFFSLVVVSFIAIFINVLFYTVCLLVLSVFVLFCIVSFNYLRVLIFLLITIVYVGAMMVLIGYICAVSPNFDMSPAFKNSYIFIFSVLGYLVSFSYYGFFSVGRKLGTLSDYFFSNWGFLIFLLITFMLFLTLLIVTSQYNIPSGPFRSSL